MNYNTGTVWGSFTYNTPVEIYTAEGPQATSFYSESHSGLFGSGFFGSGFFGAGGGPMTTSYSAETATAISFVAE